MGRIRIALLLCLACLAGSGKLWAAPLWELEGTHNQVRLLGSIHFLRPGDYPLAKSVERAFDDADVIVMELDFDEIDPVTSLDIIQRLALDPDGGSLSGALGPATWRRAERKAARIEIDLDAMQPFEPWFAALQITQLRLQQLGFDPAYGLEARLVQQAAREGKPVRGLETMEAQLAALDSLPPDAQRDFLMQTLDEAATVDDSADTIIAAWKAGNTDTLEQELLAALREQPELYDRILRQRNRNWTGQIGAMIDARDNYLIVVGTLHLVGEDSVLAMLAEEGFPSHPVD